MAKKAPKKEMDVLFSVNGAANLLEKDRQTLVRALRHVTADGFERGQPRWRLPTIVNALMLKTEARRETGKCRDRYSLRSPTLDVLRREYEKRVASIAAERSLDKRRDMALQLAPLLQEYQTTYRDIGRSLVNDDALSARAELIFQEMMDEVSAAAEWPRHGDDNDFWIRMCEVMWPDEDEAA
jgi:hypothetical protein